MHAHYGLWADRQTDTRTNGHTDTRSDELLLNEQMWGSLMLAPNYVLYLAYTIIHTNIQKVPGVHAFTNVLIEVLKYYYSPRPPEISNR